MKKILYTLSLLLISSTVFAFGGSGGTEMLKKEEETAGFDALGLHFGPDGHATIDFTLGAYWCRSGKISQCMQRLKNDYPETYKCATNADCAARQFCKIEGLRKQQSVPLSSACTNITDETKKEVIWKGKKYLECFTSPCQLSLWSARNWCAANDMRLVTLKDLGIDASKRTSACNSTHDADIDWEGLEPLLGNAGYWHIDNAYNSDNVFLIRYLDPEKESEKPDGVRDNFKCVYASPYTASVNIICTQY